MGFVMKGKFSARHKLPNPWGLFDIHGNVWEWVQDGWHENYVGTPVNGTEWCESCATAARVLRGGAWRNNAGGARVTRRGWNAPGFRLVVLGLRLVQDL